MLKPHVMNAVKMRCPNCGATLHMGIEDMRKDQPRCKKCRHPMVQVSRNSTRRR